MNFLKSETLQCLINAFVGESIAANKYTIYAKIAKKENLNIVSEIFLETVENEREHASLFYKEIPNGIYTPKSEYNFFTGNTYENLISSANAEKEEWEIIYKNSSQTAKAEGFDRISLLFKNISEIEKRHSHRFSVLADNLNNDTLLKKPEISQWICTKCGHTHIGKSAPCVCPVCNHEQNYFKLFSEKI